MAEYCAISKKQLERFGAMYRHLLKVVTGCTMDELKEQHIYTVECEIADEINSSIERCAEPEHVYGVGDHHPTVCVLCPTDEGGE